MPQDENNREMFSRHGVKNTRQRNMVLEFLKKNDDPLTAEQLFMSVNSVDAAISLSTVYRILDTFLQHGIVEKVSFTEGNKSMYELVRNEHRHYLVCVGCKRVMPVNGCPLQGYEKTLEEKTRFQITGHKLEIYGWCPLCWDKHQEEERNESED